MNTLWTDLTVLWIGFCLTGPISLCLDSFLHVLCVLLYKPVPNMTYNVFSGTLNPTQSINFCLTWSQRSEIGCLPYFHTWCGFSANLECMSEMCCTWLAENTGRKNRHFGTIAQLCRAVSLQLRHVLTIGKNLLNNNTSCTFPRNMLNFGLLTAEICWRVWGTPANFNGFHILAALLHDTLVVGVSQALRRWTEGATYIRQGGHHIGHWPTF